MYITVRSLISELRPFHNSRPVLTSPIGSLNCEVPLYFMSLARVSQYTHIMYLFYATYFVVMLFYQYLIMVCSVM